MKVLKMLALFALCLSITVTNPAQYDVIRPQGSSVAFGRQRSPQILLRVLPKNLISNGAFRDGPDYSKRFHLVRRLNDWQVSQLAEVGPGLIYNRNWGKTVVAELDVYSNTAYTYPITVEKGIYYAAFDWAPRDYEPLKSSQIKVRWNGKLLFILRSFNQRQVFTKGMIFISSGAENNFTLTGAGDSNSRGATFSNFRVYKINQTDANLARHNTSALRFFGCLTFLSYPQKTLNTNGNFEDITFPLNKINFHLFSDSHLIPGWFVNGTGVLTKADFQNPAWESPNSHALLLDSTTQFECQTEFEGSDRYYIISLDFAPVYHQFLLPQTEEIFKICQFKVFFNGKQVIQLTHQSYSVKRQFLKVRGKEGANKLTFTTPNIYFPLTIGSAIDNVEVHSN